MSWIVLAYFSSNLATAEDTPLSPLHLRARTGRDLHNLIVERVRDATPIKLRELQALLDRSAAIAAAWELARQTIAPGRNDADVAARKAALSRFIGFVEGRLGLEIPQFWERSIFTAEITSQGLTVFKPDDSDMPYRELRESAKPPGVGSQMIGMISPTQASIRHDGTNWQFILGREQFVMPREFIGNAVRGKHASGRRNAHMISQRTVASVEN